MSRCPRSRNQRPASSYPPASTSNPYTPPSSRASAPRAGPSTRSRRPSFSSVRPSSPPPCHGAFSPLALSLPLTPSLSVGRLNQAEFSERIDPLLASPDGHKERLHNQLIAAIYGNVTREMPDQGLAPWVSANDKPSTTTGSKPVSGDAAERRLKGEVMQLPSRDRRRLKDLALNDVRRPRWASIPLGRWLTCCQYDPYESLAGAFADASRLKIARTHDIPASAGGLNRMSMWSRLWEREGARC